MKPYKFRIDRSVYLTSLLTLALLSGCAGGLSFPTLKTAISTSDPISVQTRLAAAAPGARLFFNTPGFFTLTSPNPGYNCAGDAKTYYDPFALSSGLPTPFPANVLDSTYTVRPSFIKNVSVDLTNSNNSADTQNAAFSCSFGTTNSIPSSNCAVFDSTESGQITVRGYQSGYYSTFDDACLGAGPIVSTDPTITKQYVGGIFMDIDRSQLSAKENLLLHLTFLPLGHLTLVPDISGSTTSLLTGNPAHSAVIKVHLSRSGQSGDTLRQVFQPRSLSYADTTSYPLIADSMLTIPPPYGQIREEQIYIPLSIDPAIDRIRIQRVSGSMIFIGATLMRLGIH